MSSIFPNGIDEITSFLNIEEKDIPLINKFEEYLKINDLTNASLILKQIPNFDRKIITANKMNEIISCIINLEKFYNAEIYPYLENLQEDWKKEISDFYFVGNYDPLYPYKINNMVLFSSNGDLNMYIRTRGNNLKGKNPLDINYWRQITVKGERGISSNSETTFCFDWDSSQTYSANSIVVSDNRWWIAKNQNKNSKPLEGSSNWELIMSSIQSIYPLSKETPLYQQEGELWFETTN